jgi:hypothetical protein
MAQSKIVDVAGEKMFVAAPKIIDAKPVGTQILFEKLTAQEILGSKIHVSDDMNLGAPQGYVLSLGPSVAEAWGVKVGDRVIMSGSFTPLPDGISKSGRELGLIEPHAIKAVLIEQK